MWPTLSGNDRHTGGPEGTRTPDLRFRKPLLYPAELPGRRGFDAMGRGLGTSPVGTAPRSPPETKNARR